LSDGAGRFSVGPPSWDNGLNKKNENVVKIEIFFIFDAASPRMGGKP
jgi:hypothetical protein